MHEDLHDVTHDVISSVTRISNITIYSPLRIMNFYND